MSSEVPEAACQTYCLPNCLRNRTDDGSMMIACDACDNWLHPGCLGDAAVTTDDESFVCPACLETQVKRPPARRRAAPPSAPMGHRYRCSAACPRPPPSTCLRVQADVYLADTFGADTDALIGI